MRQPRGAVIRCPWHDDRSPPRSVRLAGDDTIAVRCHACGASGDALHLVAVAHGLDMRADWTRVLEIAASLAGQPMLDRTDEQRERDPIVDVDASDATYHTIWTWMLDGDGEHRGPCELTAGHPVRTYLERRGIHAHAEAAGVHAAPSRGCGARSRAPHPIRARGSTSRRHRACRPRRHRLAGVSAAHPVALARRADLVRPASRPGGPHAEVLLAARTRSRMRRTAWNCYGIARMDDEVIITEGALDACHRRAIASAERDIRSVVLGIYSASSPGAGLPLDVMRGRRVVIAVDVDDAGERAAAQLVDVLADVAGELVREVPSRGGDWGEAMGATAVERCERRQDSYAHDCDTLANGRDRDALGCAHHRCARGMVRDASRLHVTAAPRSACERHARCAKPRGRVGLLVAEGGAGKTQCSRSSR